MLQLDVSGMHVIDCNMFKPASHSCSFEWLTCGQSALAGLANIASNYLIAGQEAKRHGTSHPSIVPYQVFPCKDGFLMIGAGNAKQVTLHPRVTDIQLN